MKKETWLESFGPDKEIWKMEEKGDTVLYLTRDKPNGDPYGRVPMFHVWKGDEWRYCGASQEKADQVFSECVEESR